MKKITLILAALLALALLTAGPASAAHHKPKCPKHTHRNGKVCVKVKTVRGPQGEAGATGATGTATPAPSAPAATLTPSGFTTEQIAFCTKNPGQYNICNPEPNPYIWANLTPESRTDNPPSLGYAATGTTQFGTQIAIAPEGGVIGNRTVEVLMSVWTCEHGEWNAGCVTNNAAATFNAPLTLNIYEVGFENAVGPKLTSVSKTFALRYRPSASAACGAGSTQYQAEDGKCFNGLPQAVTFPISGLYPHKFIVAVEYHPSNAPGDPLNSLNVGLEGPPSVGQNSLEGAEQAYSDSGHAFGLEGGWVVGEQLAARIR